MMKCRGKIINNNCFNRTSNNELEIIITHKVIEQHYKQYLIKFQQNINKLSLNLHKIAFPSSAKDREVQQHVNKAEMCNPK